MGNTNTAAVAAFRAEALNAGYTDLVIDWFLRDNGSIPAPTLKDLTAFLRAYECATW